MSNSDGSPGETESDDEEEIVEDWLLEVHT
jgi:hypothetical protein